MNLLFLLKSVHAWKKKEKGRERKAGRLSMLKVACYYVIAIQDKSCLTDYATSYIGIVEEMVKNNRLWIVFLLPLPCNILVPVFSHSVPFL